MPELSKYDRLCWETGVNEISPLELWRVYSVREFVGKPLRHTNWFTTKLAAIRHAEWIQERGGKVLSVGRYCRGE